MASLYGLLGGTIGHSLSPQIHNYIYQKFNIKADYQLYETKRLAETFQDLKRRGIAGFNVTIPYKQAIIPLLDGLTARADKMQSVNTVSLIDGCYIGDNTDAFGFASALKYHRLSVANKIVLLIGAGGAASAVIHHLVASGAKMILIYNRTRANTNQLMIRVKQAYDWQNVMSVFDYHGLVVDTIVNATPLGGGEQRDSMALDLNVITANLFIDLVYRPQPTTTMQLARTNNMRTVGGLSMLVYQALEASAIWHAIAYSADDAKEIIDHVETLL